MKSKLSIIDIENNKNELSKILPSLNIDSIFLEQDGKIDKVFYNDDCICGYQCSFYVEFCFGGLSKKKNDHTVKP